MESVVIDRREVYDDWTRVRMEWTIIKGNAVRVFTIDHTIYSGQELKDRTDRGGLSRREALRQHRRRTLRS